MLLLMLFWRREQEVPAPRELEGIGTRSTLPEPGSLREHM